MERALSARDGRQPVAEPEASEDARVFSGAGDGDERAAAFGGPEEPLMAAPSGIRQ